MGDKFYGSSISKEDFQTAKARYCEKIKFMEQQITQLDARDKDFMNYIDFGLSLLLHLDIYYLNASIEIEQKIVSSVFPEKLIFDGEKH